MIRHLALILRNKAGTAAAEMALVTPLLLGLMFGSFELGNYFLSEHAVVKAVRDGARYASRLGISNYSCPAVGTGTLTGSTNEIQNVTRTGSPDGSASPRLYHWTSNGTVTITVTCASATTYTGIFKDLPGQVPVVTVAASVSYPSLFSQIGLRDTSLTLNAQSQAAVMGI